MLPDVKACLLFSYLHGFKAFVIGLRVRNHFRTVTIGFYTHQQFTYTMRKVHALQRKQMVAKSPSELTDQIFHRPTYQHLRLH